MACLNTLKEEIKILESVFPKHHDRFQIHFATMDELSCKFVVNPGKTYEINANITVSRLTFHYFQRVFIIHMLPMDYSVFNFYDFMSTFTQFKFWISSG